MPQVTKTLHPLPFHHLEPKRFEDLVRQLAYDFRNWRALEATGTGGSDDSFDIRGWEAQGAPAVDEVADNEETLEGETESVGKDRLWLIQCKREQEIGPKKLVGYVDAIPEEEAKKLHGVIVAASCTFSKAARDDFINRCRERGFAECYLWSRSELEDMLYQPKNDGILFAYFGISLTIRKRAVSTKVRSRLAMKRKAIRAFESNDVIARHVLLLDVNAEQYPYREGVKSIKELPWRICMAESHHPRGILLEFMRTWAYIADDGISWDAADAHNTVIHPQYNTWVDADEEKQWHENANEIRKTVDELTYINRAQLIAQSLLPYDRIVDIDAEGDSFFKGPIVYLEFERPNFIGLDGMCEVISVPVYKNGEDGKPVSQNRDIQIALEHQDENRIKFFPDHLRLVK